MGASMNNGFSVSIVGGGAVGQAIAANYGGVKIYDKYKDSQPIEQVAAADYIFVAVPTPYQNGQDLAEMDDAIATIVKHLTAPDRQVIIIKSTVLPGTTDRYQEKYPEANFIFNPEFLTQSVAVEDFAHPDKQLVGFTKKTRKLAEEVMEILPPAPYQKILPAPVCEMTKYAINSYYAYKVIFANQIYDFCQALGLDYNLVHEGVVADPRIIDTHFDVMHGGYRGYDGKCLPKDVKTLAWLARKNNVDPNFIETIITINDTLRQAQGIKSNE